MEEAAKKEAERVQLEAEYKAAAAVSKIYEDASKEEREQYLGSDDPDYEDHHKDDVPQAHVVFEYVWGDNPQKQPYATKTPFGWCVAGPSEIKDGESKPIALSIFEFDVSQEVSSVNLERQVEKFWSLEQHGFANPDESKNSVEDKKALEILQETTKLKDGRYEVGLLWNTKDPHLPNNRTQAERRLRQLKRRFVRDSEFAARYKAVMEEYISIGYAKKLSDEEAARTSAKTWYLPHHGVTNPNKAKVRVVYDAAAVYGGTSLNKELFQGPQLNNSLIGVLMRFRKERIAVSSDIESMFHRVACREEDTDALRFLWWNGNEDEPSDYKMTVHLFEYGYGTVSYLRKEAANGTVECAFITSKSRTAPLQYVSIPRLELQAATIAVRVHSMIVKEINLTISSAFFWTDSRIVIQYINNESRRFKTYVANRVAEIRCASQPDQWRHCLGLMNPADDASRGLSAQALLDSERWFTGPAFLLENEPEWPSLEIEALPESDPEVKNDKPIFAMALPDNLHELLLKYSSWSVLQRKIAWLLKFKEYLQSQKNKGSTDIGVAKYLSPADIERATLSIVKLVQRETYAEEIETLKVKDSAKSSSSLSKLRPNLSDGILRVRGRITEAPITFDARFPMILPPMHHVSRLLITHFHERVNIPKFSGNIKNYESWKAAFYACVDKAKATPEYKLLRLRECLQDDALRVVDNLGYSPAAYEAAKTRLERKYGGVRRALTLRLDEMNTFKPVREGNEKDLERLAELLDVIVVNLKDAGQDAELGSGSLYITLLRKLNKNLLAKYKQWINDKHQDETVEQLREFTTRIRVPDLSL
ncbi:hypothetical protein QZH41_005587 [Actinostola sp. cb2023]|nr:hypothetical protein QZH41_005587 [Actinostola sp. cb2023]